MAGLHFAPINTNAVKITDLGSTLYSTMGYCLFASNVIAEMQTNTAGRGPEGGRLALAADPDPNPRSASEIPRRQPASDAPDQICPGNWAPSARRSATCA